MAIILGAWCSVALTLFIFSFLYKDNPFYRFAEHIFIGITVGYHIAFTIFQYLEPKLYTPLFKEGRLEVIFPAIVGLIVLARLIPRIAWISRWAFAFIMGYASGVSIPTAIDTYVMPHVGRTVLPLVREQAGRLDWSTSAIFLGISDLLVVIIVICTLFYFFFSIEHKGPVRIAARLGIMFLMIAFGAAYGYTVMGRMALLIGRIYDLKRFSGASFYYATPILLIAVIASLLLFELLKRRKT
jgi:hypothetical protein